jgi:hypothetical protein
MRIERIGHVAHGLHAFSRSRERRFVLSEVLAAAPGEEKSYEGGKREGRWASHPLQNSKNVGEFAMAPMVGYALEGHMRRQ